MINIFNRKKKILFVAIICFSIIITACNINPQRPQQEEENSPPEVPNILEELETAVLEAMHNIDSIEGLEIAMEEQEAEEEPPGPPAANVQVETEGELEPEISVQEPEETEEADEENKLEMSVSENQTIIPLLEEEDIEGLSNEMSQLPEDIEEIWFEIEDQVEGLHRMWNVLEADLRDLHVSQEEITAFEEKLMEASVTIMEKETIESLMTLNELTKYLADFRNAFTSKVPSPVYKMKYHIRNSILYGSQGEFETAQEHIDKTKELKNSLQQQIVEKGAEHDGQKLDLSIADLERQLAAENFPLMQIEGAIVIKNILLIQDAFKGAIDE
ncbi:hypothetical protein SAMN05660297_01272 [Natronincola peptidivorans]|uniref:Uncharacterized protein n=1 Tax=Natronincola peptidivorans TaxID=426128 RepID=A0A1I0BIH8_9FIRM|nr:hypothetical protein [Natronincola peptidivorans]SET06363.1 hypothetical protein SAMN05660297_01272 [Natronincola peptidivorans]